MNFRLKLIYITLLLILFSCNSDIWRKQNSPESYIEKLDSSLSENSGIIYWNKLIWTFNDSGGKNEIYACNTKTGKIRVTIQIENALNVDWEDLAQDEKFIYIAETGNNVGNRSDLKIYKLRKSNITNERVQKLSAETINYKYADQKVHSGAYKKNRYDCEALFSFNDSLYLFTKDWLTNITKAYVFPNDSGSYSIMPTDSFNVNGLITGADIKSDSSFALVGYKNYKSFAWTFKKTNNELFSTPKRIDLGMLENAQTEGICYTPEGDLLISCEITFSHLPQIWRIRKNKF